nr:MAG TPA: hypothetical protein [Caudoviricetes sp.]
MYMSLEDVSILISAHIITHITACKILVSFEKRV